MTRAVILLSIALASSGCTAVGQSIGRGVARFSDAHHIDPGQIVELHTRAEPAPTVEGVLASADEGGDVVLETSEGPRRIASTDIGVTYVDRAGRWDQLHGTVSFGEHLRVTTGKALLGERFKGTYIGVVDGQLALATPRGRILVAPERVERVEVLRGDYAAHGALVGLALDLVVVTALVYASSR